MKKTILITTLAMFAGCATQRDYDLENLLFEEDALLIAKAEVPTKKDLEKKDTCKR